MILGALLSVLGHNTGLQDASQTNVPMCTPIVHFRCVNGNGLTAMILGAGRHRFPKKPKHHQLEGVHAEDGDGGEDERERDVEVSFGENLQARLVTVSCPTPP